MTKKRVLITPSYIDVGTEAHQQLLAAGIDVIFNPFRGHRTEEEMILLLRGVDGAIVAGDRITASVLAAADRLRVISRTGVGYDSIDVQAATARKIAICTAPGTNSDSVADYTLALILQCSRKMIENYLEMQRGAWVRHEGVDLRDKLLGIVGLGTIGKAVAFRAAAFGMRIAAFAPHRDEQFADRHSIHYLPLEQLLRESDYVTLHLPLNADTRHLINAQRLAIMKPTAYLINTARGAIVDTDALYQALRQGQIAGAALDVFEEEPLRDSRLQELPNLYLSAHTAGCSVDARRRAVKTATDNLLAVLQGKRPDHVVNPEALHNPIPSSHPLEKEERHIE